VVGYGTFEQLVTAVGGVTLHHPGMSSQPGSGVIARRVPAVHLDAAGVLRYVRSRSAADMDDSDRMRRQQEILLALMNQQLQVNSLFQIPTLVNALGGTIVTNFPYNQTPELAHALSKVPRSRIHRVYLSRANHAVSSYVNSGERVLLPDWQRIRTIAQSIMPGPRFVKGAVEVMNGSNVAGQAADLANWLRDTGIPVLRSTTAPSSNYPQTKIILQGRATAADARVAHTVATLLQVPLVTGSVQHTGAHVVVIIGRDFQDPTHI
jgi:hypothetical protein